MSAVEIIGHRGASHDAPENTITSFRLGYEQGADGNELDLQLTRDGRIVVAHDPDTRRTAGLRRRIARMTLAEMRRLEVGKWGKWKDKGFTERIPTLDEALAQIPTGKKLFLEIKAGPEILAEFENVVRRAGLKPEQTPVIGFGYKTMKAAKARLPELPVYWLVSAGRIRRFLPVKKLIDQAKAARLDGLDLSQGFPINAEFVKKVHAAGLKLFTWTVDNPAVARKQVEAGVDGITTNRPGWLREQLGLK